MSRVSVIIPVFDVEPYLDACLDSLVAQDMTRIGGRAHGDYPLLDDATIPRELFRLDTARGTPSRSPARTGRRTGRSPGEDCSSCRSAG